MSRDRLLRFVLVGLWLVLPFTAGAALADALDDVDTAVRTLASVGLWAAWGAVVAAVLVPRPVGLTAVRVGAPYAAAATVAAAADGHRSVAGLSITALATALALTPDIGEVFVNGAAYPNERRHLLRSPGALLLGPLPLAWAIAGAGVVAGPLLLAAERWVLGGLATAIGVPAGIVLLRAMHGLVQRWVVFVPTGVVLHDNLALTDPVLFRRQTVAGLHPAPADSDGVDLTQRAPGLALELDLREPANVVLSRPGRRAGEPVTVQRLLFTPTRPGRVLAEAATRRLPVH